MRLAPTSRRERGPQQGHGLADTHRPPLAAECVEAASHPIDIFQSHVGLTRSHSLVDGLTPSNAQAEVHKTLGAKRLIAVFAGKLRASSARFPLGIDVLRMEHAGAACIHLAEDSIEDGELSLDDEMRQVVWKVVLAATRTLSHDKDLAVGPLDSA